MEFLLGWREPHWTFPSSGQAGLWFWCSYLGLTWGLEGSRRIHFLPGPISPKTCCRSLRMGEEGMLSLPHVGPPGDDVHGLVWGFSIDLGFCFVLWSLCEVHSSLKPLFRQCLP